MLIASTLFFAPIIMIVAYDRYKERQREKLRQEYYELKRKWYELQDNKSSK